jgi:alpha-glucuronidase
VLLLTALSASAETGREAWLRYAPLDDAAKAGYGKLPAAVAVVGNGGSPVLENARAELVRGVRGMLGRTLRHEDAATRALKEPAFVLGTEAALKAADPAFKAPPLGKDGYWLAEADFKGARSIVIASPDERGVLYGVFAFLRKVATEQPVAKLDEASRPMAPVRWVDHWDNLDGTIERGYGGPSIFFEKDDVREDLSRVGEYARLLASVGVNGININNVNANPRVIQDVFIPQLRRVADVFRPWGIRLSVSVDLSSPQKTGGLDTFDPMDAGVVQWWRGRVDALYGAIPDFGGFTVKADSEGREGPSSYGRTPADAANMLAKALAPRGGVLFYRAFVYDHHLDWTNLKNDRARAAYDIFHPLDGKFEENVIIQIKHGPIDFQAREPVSPVFGGLAQTNVAVELPVMQEYTGQQHHMVYLMPYWRGLLDFDLQAKGAGTPLKDILSGKVFGRSRNGYVAVVNVGMDDNWLGHAMGMANLYGYGRLAWDANLGAGAIAEEWTRLTFGPFGASGKSGKDSKVLETVTSMLMDSWRAYENYTGPLGAQTFTDITGSHFGPNVEASERNGWGQWHRGDEKGIGMDRSVATGTGYAGQYAPPVAAMYESLETTPDELVLWFHHVPYDYKLKSGKTVVQHVYDAHYDGAAAAEGFAGAWRSLRGLVDERRYGEILAKLEFQAGHARVWRDAVNDWFRRKSGVPDAKNRVGSHPGRVEAEAMRLEGYRPVDILPTENASGGKGVECQGAKACSAEWEFDRAAGWYTLDVEYYDVPFGAARYRVLVNGQEIDAWTADNRLPAWKSGADASSRRRVEGVALRPGDLVRVEGAPDGKEPAGFDFIELK